MGTNQALNYANQNRQRFLDELKTFIRFPSVSAQPHHAAHLQQCAEWLANHLRDIGLNNVWVIPTKRHPLVYADWNHQPDQPTVLIYGHYDVQPADPLNEWHSPPFEPRVENNYVFGRGASDDKGQLFTHIKALEAYLQSANRQLPVNVVCLFEGEEEIGSASLTTFLSQPDHGIRADVAVLSDMPILGANRPAITHAMRGALSLELTVRGPERDLHSGIYGGAIHNPLEALADIVSRLHNSQGRIIIPSFYDRVRLWNQAERDYMARVGPSDTQMLRDARAVYGWGESDYSLYERTAIRPSLSINGITGGYQERGGKAVIPSQASAKISFRLVPDQNPNEIERLFRLHIHRITPHSVRSSVRTYFHGDPVLMSRQHPVMTAAAAAYRHGFGVEPVFLRSGGSIPIINTFRTRLAIPTAMMGFALPNDQMHGPNERFYLPNFYRGIATSIHFLDEIIRHLPRHTKEKTRHDY